jgi:hypothetical protein
MVIKSFGPLCSCWSGVDVIVAVGVAVGVSANVLLVVMATLQFPIGLTEPEASVRVAVAVKFPGVL